jgi:hypothetical protein
LAKRVPDVIPPGSFIRLAKVLPDQDGRKDRVGKVFRVGYSSKIDGLDCVWLVNDASEYTETWDQKGIREQFEILSLSDGTDLFGDNRPPLKALHSQTH